MNADKTNERNINCFEADKIVRNIEQVYICQGCNCDINDNGFCSEGCIFDDEVQPHCQVCFNMNSNLFVTKNALNPICRGKCVKKLIEKQSGLQTEIEENKLKINNLIAEHKQKDVEIDNLLEKLEPVLTEKQLARIERIRAERKAEYMNELIECNECECFVKRKNLAWSDTGSYYGFCEECREEVFAETAKIREKSEREAEEQLKADFAQEWSKEQSNRDRLDLLSKTFDKKIPEPDFKPLCDTAIKSVMENTGLTREQTQDLWAKSISFNVVLINKYGDRYMQNLNEILRITKQYQENLVKKYKSK
jgi:hypothetical protein